MRQSPRAIRRERLLRRAEDPTSPLPLVAIVGRPNVGKSTLFNRLVGGHNAIVEDEPGVTRDRRYGETEYAGRGFRVVDTGGLESVPSSPLSTSIQKQALRAIEESSLVLFVVDAQHGIVAEDREVLDKLRRLGRPILYVANKVDGPRQEALIGEIYAVGAPQVYGISAAHGRGLPDLLEDLIAALPPPVETDAETEGADADEDEMGAQIYENIFGSFLSPAIIRYDDTHKAVEALVQEPLDSHRFLWTMTLRENPSYAIVLPDMPEAAPKK